MRIFFYFFWKFAQWDWLWVFTLSPREKHIPIEWNRATHWRVFFNTYVERLTWLQPTRNNHLHLEIISTSERRSLSLSSLSLPLLCERREIKWKCNEQARAVPNGEVTITGALLRDSMHAGERDDEIDIGSWANRGKRYGLRGRFADIGHSILGNPDSLTRP